MLFVLFGQFFLILATPRICFYPEDDLALVVAPVFLCRTIYALDSIQGFQGRLQASQTQTLFRHNMKSLVFVNMHGWLFLTEG